MTTVHLPLQRQLMHNISILLKDHQHVNTLIYIVESCQMPLVSDWSVTSSRALGEKFCFSTCESFWRKETISFEVRNPLEALEIPGLLKTSSIQPFTTSSMHRSTLASVPFSDNNALRIWVIVRLHSGTSMSLSLISFKTDLRLEITAPISAPWREEVTTESGSVR